MVGKLIMEMDGNNILTEEGDPISVCKAIENAVVGVSMLHFSVVSALGLTIFKGRTMF